MCTHCGCKTLRGCYKNMLLELLQGDEDPCIENVSINPSTVTVYLKALQKYCGRIIEITENDTTYESRTLYKVLTKYPPTPGTVEILKPMIVIDAGQDASEKPVGFALFVLEQLMACSENKLMLQKAQWLFLPATNPDGLEYARSKREPWVKNFRPTQSAAYGVDITRNFDDSWELCHNNQRATSPYYPGPNPGSENETKFITKALSKYRTEIKAYVSLRRDGHAILFPFASRNVTLESVERVQKRAGELAVKVNQRAGTVQWFVNDSIYNMNGHAHCGHSVDYAFTKQDIPYAFEMRIFPESDFDILYKFQKLPKGQEVTLRAGYFSGIRELFNLIINEYVAKTQ